MTLFMGRGATMRFLLAVLPALLCPSIAQQQYEVHDDNTNNNNNGAAPDYTQYYAPGTAPEAKAAAAPDDSAGFVRPIDFSGLFGAASGIGVFGGVPAAAPRQVFSPVEVNPFQLAANPPALFPAPAVQTKASENGFTNPQVQFQSLFDASGAAASEVGFRPQDFLKPVTRTTEENKPAEETGYYSPSYVKSQDAYESRPGPSYTYKAVPAATSYRAAPAEEEEDEDDEEDSSYHSSYEPKQKSSAAPAEEEEEEEEPYSFKPKLKIKKSEYLSDIGKSSYPEKYQYRYTPPEGSPAPKTKSSYQHSEYPESKAAYPETPSAEYYPSKSNHQVKQKSGPSDAYDKPEVYRPSAAAPRHTDTSDIIYGKGKAPAYYATERRGTEEPHQGKSSYPAPAQYNPKKLSTAYYDPKELAPVQFTPKSAPVYKSEERKPPKVKEEEEDEEKEVEEEEDEEESREEEEKQPLPDLHGPPEYAPSGSKTDKKTCKKINKRLTADDVAKGRFRRDAMTCYQCDDPKTGGTFEQCSYTSDPKSRSYFLGRAQKYSTSASSSKPTSYRYRRYLGDHPFGEELETAETLARMVRELPRDDYYFNPEYITSERADEYKPPGTNIDKKHCKKVKKDSMTCMICKDPSTGGDYEQCAYSEKPKERNYFVSRESSFSSKKQPKSERRYIESPYSAYNSRPRSRHTREKPTRKSDSFASSTEVRTEGDKEHSSPFRYRNNEEDAGSSGKESSTPFRYRSSEDASGSSGKESSSPFRYRSNEDESENSGKESSSPFRYRSNEDESENSGKESSSPFRYRSNEDESEGSGKESSSPFRYRSNEEESESSGKEPSTPFRYRSGEEESEGSGKERHLTGQTYEEYFRRLFPELQRRTGQESEKYTYPSESKSEEEKQPVFEYKSPLPDYYMDTAHKKDLEKVLGEFRQKDRSACKKVMKDKMTCYKCVDKKGTQHEECMFVAASQPKKSHLAYEEVKEFRMTPPPGVKAPDSDSSSSSDSGKTADTSVEKDDYSTTTVTPTTTTPKPKRKAFFKKVSTTATPDNKYDETAEKLELLKLNSKNKTPGVKLQVTRRSSKTSILSTTTTPLTTRSSSSKGRVQDAAVSASEQQSKRVKPSKSKEEEDPELPPESFSPDGLYTAETRNKFDPVLKITLPAYMLQRSEHEAIFDEVMASGRRR